MGEEQMDQLDAIKKQLDDGASRMSGIERDLATVTEMTQENTTITKEIKELLDAAKLGFKVLGGLGAALKWAAGIAAALAALYALLHGGPK